MLDQLVEKHNLPGTNKKKNRGLITRTKNDMKRLEASYEPIKDTRGNNSIDDKPKNNLRTRKVKITPKDDIQKQKLDNWFGAARFVYNQCVALCNNDRDVSSMSTVEKKRKLRDHINGLIETREWLGNVPQCIRDDAICDYIKAVNSNVAKLKKMKEKGKEFKFRISFRSKKKMVQETIKINARDWVKKGGQFGDLKMAIVKKDNPLPSVVEGAVTVTKTRLGDYYYGVLTEREYITDVPHYEVIALDPGIRTFQTGYDINGVTIEWGAGDMNRIFALCRFADKLQSKWSKEGRAVNKRRQRVAWLRSLRRIHQKVDEVQRKLATFLCRNYKVILLPEFNTGRMVKTANRTISSTTARNMCTWGHYRFRELLKAKASLYSGCHLVICDEQYTSKTCGGCGYIHQSLGKSKTFHCPRCPFVSDRDINAARNILLRYLTHHPEINPNDVIVVGGVGPSGPTFAPTGLI